MKKNKMIGIVVAGIAIMAAGFSLWQTGQQNSIGGSSEPITDNRVQVTDQQDVQYQSSVLINSIDKQSEYGTGYVVGKNTVVTNRHVVLDVKDKPEKAVVRIGHKDEKGNVDFVDFKIKDIVMSEDESIDVAVLNLKPAEDGKTVSDYRKIAEFGDSSQVQVGSEVTVVGFPGDKDYATMWAGTGEVEMISEDIISFRTVTAPGNSGSPLFDNKGRVVAMNNAGGENSSFGFLIGKDILSFIQSHIE